MSWTDFQGIPFWLVGSIASGVISIVIGVILGDPIKRFFGRFVGGSRPDPILGKWVCEFRQCRGDSENSFPEVIIIRKSFGYYVGSIEPDSRNYERLKQVADKRPQRLKGERTGDGTLTGVWYHPIDTSRSHGAFQLRLTSSGSHMSGVWIGYSNTLGKIDSGSWDFSRA